MKVLVGVKRVLDYSIKVRVNPQKTGVDLQGLKMSINPFDEIAIEEAIRMREAGKVKEVVILSIGDKSTPETIRSGLAIGADSAIHIQTDMRIDQDLQPLTIAKVFAKIMKDKNFDFCLLGKQSIDDDYNQTGQILGSIMGIPCASFSSKIEFDESGKNATVTREVDFGLQKIQVSLPAVFTCDLRLNTPRFANVQSILKAKRKPIETLKLEELGIDIAPRLKVEKVEMPTERKGGVMVGSVDELINLLKNEAKVL
eukprot:403333907